jgi:hypothetical protein
MITLSLSVIMVSATPFVRIEDAESRTLATDLFPHTVARTLKMSPTPYSVPATACSPSSRQMSRLHIHGTGLGS